MNRKIIAYTILILIIIFNAYLYRGELTILADVNDNIFQYSLVDEAKNIFQEVLKGKLSIFYLFDSFNERWNEGFALSTYYAHLPQALLVIGAAITGIDLYLFFNIVKYLFLILLPVSFFFGGLILGLPHLLAALIALITQLTFTNGFYGIDSSSYLWRGWGLSSQQMAVFFLPIAFAYTYNYLTRGKNLAQAVLFNFLTAEFHFGIFYMGALSYPLITGLEIVEGVKVKEWQKQTRELVLVGWQKLKKLFILAFLTFFSLSYFIIPFYYFDNYRNFSFWDPWWKFNSFGVKQAIIWLLNGEFFDFNRWQLITFLAIFASILVFKTKEKLFKLFGLLFVFYFFIFFGRATWGNLIDLIPGLSEFHLHRFIVMVQFSGIFLAGWLVNKLLDYLKRQKLSNFFKYLILIVLLIIVIRAEKPIVKYAWENDLWLNQANDSYRQELPDYQALVNKLKQLPRGRIYVGRPGNWGRDFKVGHTALYMALTRDGFPVVGFAPESWSPTSESDQFFNEADIDYYDIFNSRYLVTPNNFKAPSFAKHLGKFGKYNLYEIKTDGWFTFGKVPFEVTSKKDELINLVKFWLEVGFKNHQYPRINFPNVQTNYTGKKIKIVDMTTYIDEKGETSTIWQKPIEFLPANFWTDLDKEEILPAGYQTSFTLLNDCDNCVVVLKQTYHPNWQVTINGQKGESFPVFPFYIGIPIRRAGTYTVRAIYQPNSLKIALIWLEMAVFIIWFILHRQKEIKFNK
ncbi:MAG: hypothetical protein QHH09_00340 [Microgenomates group bacterium]|nr:hypothetical protein [Microgenomates group bacterium]